MIQSLVLLLEPYNYGEADIYSLIKKCGFDEVRIQAAVSNILDEKHGHENDDWATTVTKSDKVVRAQEAKERREQLEKVQAEERERLREQRQRAYDEKQRVLKQEALRRKQQDDASRLRRPADASTAKPTSNAWRRDEPAQDQGTTTAAPAGGEDTPPGGSGAYEEEAEEEGHAAEHEEEGCDEPDEQEEEEEEDEEASKGQGWSTQQWYADGNHDGDATWNSAPVAAPVSDPVDADQEENPCVVMPEQFYAMMHTARMQVTFGAASVLDIGTGAAASSLQYAPQEVHADQAEEPHGWGEDEAQGEDVAGDERGAPRKGRGGYGKSRGRSRGEKGEKGEKGDKREKGEGKGKGKDGGKLGKKGAGRGGKSSGRGGKGTWRPEQRSGSQ